MKTLLPIKIILSQTTLILLMMTLSSPIFANPKTDNSSLIMIRSSVPADVLVNATHKGTTNSDLKLGKGVYILEAVKEGYYNWKKRIKIKNTGHKTLYYANLIRNPNYNYNLPTPHKLFKWCEKSLTKCVNLRYTKDCDISCTNEIAEILREKLNITVRVAKNAGALEPSGCIFYRKDAGGTEAMAKTTLSILGDSYYLSPECKDDGIAINIRSKRITN